MTFQHVLALLGGLALFLYGMHMMSEGLEQAAGDRMKTILEKLTSNRFLGILAGAGITAVIQSSSATTVMVVGFVNSKLMTLRQAVWIIMGANIGTTITGQLVALKMDDIAPILAIIGVVAVTFVKNKKINSLGEILAGLGVLFIGMGMMSDAMYPLRESQAFINMMTTISNPFIAVLFGAGFTALIQSSSASVGILQTLALSGLIPLSSSIYIIFGQNIGTCITAVLASLSASRNAKRTTLIHLSFNLIGTMVFMIAIQFIPFVDWMVAFTDNPAAQIANTHTIFNITTTCLLIPFGGALAALTEKIMPISEEELELSAQQIPLTFVNDDNIGNVTIAISSLRKEALEMMKLSEANIMESINALCGQSFDYSKVEKREDRINYINYEITGYMSKVSLLNMNQKESDTCNSLYKCFTDIERIGDHALNLAEYSREGSNKFKQSEPVIHELKELENLLQESFTLIMTNQSSNYETCYQRVGEIEDEIDKLTAQFRQNQINRLKENKVDALDCVLYSEILTDLERVSDHMINIAEEYKKYQYILSTENVDYLEVEAI